MPHRHRFPFAIASVKSFLPPCFLPPSPTYDCYPSPHTLSVSYHQSMDGLFIQHKTHSTGHRLRQIKPLGSLAPNNVSWSRVCGVALLPIMDAIETPLQSNIVILPPTDCALTAPIQSDRFDQYCDKAAC